MEKSNEYVYMILHYQTANDTEACVESIISKYDEAKIVIVDNGSTNRTGNELKLKYKNNKNIHVLLSDKNLGFANGNNLGIRYIRENFEFKFIVLMNNDTELIDENFEKEISECYENEKFAALGPKIILKDKTINPIVKKAEDVNQLKSKLRKVRVRLFLNYLYLDSLIDKLKGNKKSDFVSTEDCDEIHYNIMLHGCFFVLSQDYFKEFDGLYDRTFLYMEEEFLYYRLRQRKLKSIYYPKVQILHKEFSSTKSVTKTNHKYRMFRYRNLLKSGKLLYEFLKENSGENNG